MKSFEERSEVVENNGSPCLENLQNVLKLSEEAILYGDSCIWQKTYQLNQFSEMISIISQKTLQTLMNIKQKANECVESTYNSEGESAIQCLEEVYV